MSSSSMTDQNRGSWSNHLEFLLSGLGMAVGVANIWRFPYVTYSNGGGSFLVPYVIIVIVLGMPLLFQEMAIGQYAKVGSNKLFGHMVPILKGIGYAIFSKTLVGITYYMGVVSWAVFYLFAGFTTDLPWSTCKEDWNTRDCFSDEYNEACSPDDEIFWNFDCSSKSEYCQAHGYDSWSSATDACVGSDGETPVYEVLTLYSVSPAEDYFNGRVLGVTKDKDGTQYTWDDFGSVQWELVLCQLFGWLLVGATIIKGVRSLGKASYVLTVLPYFILTALLAYSVTLPGADEGIDFYMSSDWSLLKDSDIWLQACTQIVMSLGIGLGAHMALASYNNRDGRILLDSVAISSLNSITSIYAGFVVFAMTGFLAYDTNAEIDNVVQGGITLAFVSYPTAMLSMAVSPLWSFLFFFMLINLSLSSVSGGAQMMVAFITDEFPQLRKHHLSVLVGILCGCFLLGLPLTFNGGIHYFIFLDSRGTVSILVIALMQCTSVSWFYGMKNFLSDMEEMKLWLPTWMRWVWSAAMMFIIPGFLTYVYVYSLVDLPPIAYGTYEYPHWVQAFGTFYLLLPILLVVIYMIYFVILTVVKGMSWREFYAYAFLPTEKWQRLRKEKFAMQMLHHGGELATESKT